MRFLILFIISCHPFQSNNSSNLNEDIEYFGTTYYTWEDTIRKDPYYEGNRLINVQIWYPIDNSINKESYKTASYYYGNEEIWQNLAGWSKSDIEFISDIQTNTLIDAPVLNQNKKLPLLIFSPSLGGNLSFYNHYAQYFTRHGYIVMGVNHLFESEFIINDQNEIIPQNLRFHDSLKTLDIPGEITADEYRKVKGQRSKVLGDDLIFALNMLSKLNDHQFNGIVDLNKVGVWGHSFGGTASIEAALVDDRFGAVLNIDGTPPTLESSQILDKPFMFIEDLTDYETHDGLMKQYIRRDQFCASVENKAYRILIAETNHQSFWDFNYHSAQRDSEKKKALQVLNKTSSYMLEFFNHTLLNKQSNLTNLKSESLEIKIFKNN